MKYFFKLVSAIICYRPSKIGTIGMVLLGMIMGRIAANIAMNENSTQLNSALLVIVIGGWLILFVRKVVNNNKASRT